MCSVIHSGAQIFFSKPSNIRNLQHSGTPRNVFPSLTVGNPSFTTVTASSSTPRVRVSSRALSMDTSIQSESEKSKIKSKIRVIEHVVLLKLKEGVAEAQAEAMVSALRGLKCLPSVIHITAGKNNRYNSGISSGDESFSHALHSRYYSKEDLESYANDPLHLEVIKYHTAPIVEDRIAIDWETELEEPELASSGSVGAVRIVAMRPSSGPSVSHLVDVFSAFEAQFRSIKQVSFGTNFSTRSKGYEFGYVALLPNLHELSELSQNEEYVNVHKSTIMPALEKYTVVDYSST